MDFSQDRTDFFADELKRSVVIQAARDWAEFFDGTDLDPVGAGVEQTFIWKQDGFDAGQHVRNESPHTGLLLYADGIWTPELRSGEYELRMRVRDARRSSASEEKLFRLSAPPK